jgi:curved DNA-binding protein CbpA
MQKFDPERDYYKILGIGPEASQEEIDRAFRGEARKHHPDGGGSEEAMKSLNEAHDILSDSASRQAYDRARAPQLSGYASSVAVGLNAGARSDAFRVAVADADLAGLMMGAAACFGLGVPLLFLVETQWMFFLWPLRIISLGAIGLGLLMSRWALAARHRYLKTTNPHYRRAGRVVHELLFWLAAALVVGIIVIVYAA